MLDRPDKPRRRPIYATSSDLKNGETFERNAAYFILSGAISHLNGISVESDFGTAFCEFHCTQTRSQTDFLLLDSHCDAELIWQSK
ncbi:hypothetical protein CO709_22390 [Burkholderia thailandensis]|nr:hypothetical protein CO709_22390 [Burkholderia thailandensis]